jgi:HD-like signal output (HDOD) protein
MEDSQVARDPKVVVGSIRDFLVDAEALPSPKGAALQLIELSRNPDASITDVVKVIRSDPALSGFVLRAASAARFGRTERALDLQHAVVRLGLNIVRAHALALSLASSNQRISCPSFDYNAFWSASLLDAAVMEALARHRGDIPAAEAFTLGLLSDIGKLAFATAAPQQYDGVLRKAATVDGGDEAAEKQTFGFDRHELSAVLLADWGIPTTLADVVYWQCDPEGGGFDADSRSYRLACGLQFAARLVETCMGPSADSEMVATVYLRAATLDLSPEEAKSLAAEALAELPVWTGLVGLPAPVVHNWPVSWPD